MKKISFAAFGAVFGGLVVGGADASIISRSFLDEALESYATTTALDLKANQSDLTNLSNKIGNAWPYMFDMALGLHSLSLQLYPQEINLENTSDLVRFLFGGQMESGISGDGVLNLLAEGVYYFGAYDIKTGQIDDGFRSLTQLTDGWTDSQRKTYLGVRGLNDMIANNLGTVFLYDPNPKSTTGYIKVPTTDLYEVLGFSNNFDLLRFPFAGQVVETNAGATLMPLWKLTQSAYKTEELSTKIGTLPKGDIYTSKGLFNLMPEADFIYPDSLGDFMASMYDMRAPYPSLSKLADAIFFGTMNNSSVVSEYRVKGLYQITQEIGTLPTGTFDISSPGLNEMFRDGKSFLVTIPSGHTLSDLFLDLYTPGSPLPSISDVAYITMHGGELSQFWAGEYGIPSYKGLIDLTKDVNKIGTLPSGDMPSAPVWSDSLLLNSEEIYPTSLAGLMELLLGNKEGRIGILQRMVRGFPLLSDNSGDEIGLYYNYIRAKEANDKIGRLPTKYSTVGAALSAMDAKIDAHELPADSDDGQYVLSAKKVGDTITYTWVKMDLTDAEK